MPLTVTAPELVEENATGPIQPICEKNEPESTDALEGNLTWLSYFVFSSKWNLFQFYVMYFIFLYI